MIRTFPDASISGVPILGTGGATFYPPRGEGHMPVPCVKFLQGTGGVNVFDMGLCFWCSVMMWYMGGWEMVGGDGGASAGRFGVERTGVVESK